MTMTTPQPVETVSPGHAGDAAEPLDAGSTLRRSGSVGVASLASMAGGLLTNKVTAVIVGAPGVGYNSVLQGHAANVALIADLNVTHGMVRRVAGARADHQRADDQRADDQRANDSAGLRSTTIAASLSVTAAVSAVLLCVTVAASHRLAGLLLPSRGSAAALVACVAAGCMLMLTAQMQAAMSALGALRTYRRTLFAQAAAAPVIAWLLLRRAGIEGLPLAQVVGTTAALAITVVQLTRTVRHLELPRPRLSAVRSEMGGLLRQGALFTIAAVTGSGVANVLPLLVLTRLGETAAGQYRAAVVLSAGYVTVLTTTLGREFLPRAASLTSNLVSFNAAVDRQVRIICALATPVVVAGLLFSPLAVRVLFSGEFDESVRILAFQFPGDLLRLVSQTFVYSLIAASGGRHMVVTEIAGGLALLVCVFGGLHLMGLPGLGLATSVAYAIYAVVALVLLRSATGFRLSRRTIRLLTLSLLAVTVPTVIVISAGRTAGSIVGGIVLIACLFVLLGRLAPRTPPSIALFAHRFDARLLGPSPLLPSVPTTQEIHS